jgi:thiol-disulfide isomerase/thioredoxin
MVVRSGLSVQHAEGRYLRPNRFVFTIQELGYRGWCDGTTVFSELRDRGTSGPAEADSFLQPPLGLEILNEKGVLPTKMTRSRVNGRDAIEFYLKQNVESVYRKKDVMVERTVVDAKTLLPIRWDHVLLAEPKASFTVTYTDWNVRPHFTDADFSLRPSGAVTYVADLESLSVDDWKGKTFLPFAGRDQEGNAVSLSLDGLKKQVLMARSGRDTKRCLATLLNFYFYECGPCRAEFPTLDRVYRSLRDKGFEVLAINPMDGPDVVKKFYAANKFEIQTVMGAHLGSQYKVFQYPVSLLIDSSGTVCAVFTGEIDETELRAKLAELGVK